MGQEGYSQAWWTSGFVASPRGRQDAVVVPADPLEKGWAVRRGQWVVRVCVCVCVCVCVLCVCVCV